MFTILTAILIIVLFMFRALEPDRKQMNNAQVIARINELSSATPAGSGIRWDGGLNNMMTFRDFKYNNEVKRFWGVIAKSKDGKIFNIIYSEKDDVLARIDGDPATINLQDALANFKPFSSGEEDIMRKLAMMGALGGRKRRPYGSQRITATPLSTGGMSMEMNNDSGDEDGESEN
jgi:hypothetical protein